jgi:protein TonB
MIALSLPGPRKRESMGAPRWIASTLLILALHVSGVMMLMTWQRPARPDMAAPAAIMVELASAPAVTPAPPVPQPPPPPTVQSEPLPLAPAPAAAMPPKPPQRKLAPRRTLPLRQPAPAQIPQPAQVERAPVPAAPARSEPASAARPDTAPAPDRVSDYEKLLFEHLDRQKRFPRAARLRGEQGTVLVRFAMNRDGTVLSARIERSSGYRDLDDEVLSLIERAQPLPPFAATMT